MLCVGYACVDVNFSISHHPAADEKMRASKRSLCGGGPAANAAVQICRLGGSASFLGYLGDDLYGDLHASELQQAGVVTDDLLRGATPTPVAVVLIKPNGDRCIVDHRGDHESLPADAYHFRPNRAPKVLLVDGHEPALSIKLVETCGRLGIPTVLDAGSLHSGTAALFDQVDFCIASEKFARQQTGREDPIEALSELSGSAPVVAVTCGERGLYWQSGGAQAHLPAYPISAVDTTGAGDAFHGAFALGLTEGLDLEENFRRSAAVGALTCLRAGARAALPTKRALEAWLSKQV